MKWQKACYVIGCMILRLLMTRFSYCAENFDTSLSVSDIKVNTSSLKFDCGITMWAYTRQELFSVRRTHCCTKVKCECLNYLPTVSELGIQFRKTRKRGRKGGIRTRMKRRGCFKLAVPTVILRNVRSLLNKCDELQSSINHLNEYRNCCALVFTETWLRENISDSLVQVDGFNIIRADRCVATSGKEKGGGLRVYVNKKWCINFNIKYKMCSALLEILVVNCRPFYLPREISCVRFIVVYIPVCRKNGADRSVIVQYIKNSVNDCLNEKPDAAVLILGDFNGCVLDSELPQFTQYVKCKTRLEATLDLCYCNLKNAYLAKQRGPLGNSDHNNVYLIPKYRQLLKREKPAVKTVKMTDESSIKKLQGSMACTDWSIFTDTCKDIDELTDTIYLTTLCSVKRRVLKERRLKYMLIINLG